MVSVSRINSFNINNKQTQNTHKTDNVVKLNAGNPHILTDFLSLVAHQNRAAISFGKNTGMDDKRIRPFGKDFDIEVFQPRLSKYAQNQIKMEAVNRISGSLKWPKIDKINAWMITAETDDFMTEGGLGKVASDLPNRFNSRLNDSGEKMTIVTPLYTDNKPEKEGYELRYNNGVYHYKHGYNNKEGREKLLRLDLAGTINVPLYNPSDSNTNLQNNEVRIFKGKLNGTEYLFLDTSNIYPKDPFGNFLSNQADIFNIEDREGGKSTPYKVSRKSGTDPAFRMAYFSKAVYEAMKAAKEGKLDDVSAPNIAVLNDWHAGPVAPLTKYMGTAEADYGQISHEVGKYLEELPTIYIAHNVEYQGCSEGDNHRKAIFGTLFQGFGTDILNNSMSWEDAPDDKQHGLRNSMMRHKDYNSSMAGMALADRVVPVSVNYAEELLHSDIKANGLSPLMNARRFMHLSREGENTLTPITNGYSKMLIAPGREHIEKLIEQTHGDLIMSTEETPSINISRLEKLKAYHSNTLNIKTYNKNIIMDVFRQIIKRERKLQSEGLNPKRKYVLEDPFGTELPNINDFSKVPVIGHVGRIDDQKGMNTIFWGAIKKYALENLKTPKDQLPIFVIGGNISNQKTYDDLAEMKKEIKQINPELGKRILLFNGYVNTNFLATASDLFLVPSVFEPCGLTQLEAMAKGALPVATSTGGLVDTIKNGVDGFRTTTFFDQSGSECSGRIYHEPGTPNYPSNADAYYDTLKKAIDKFYNDRDGFKEMQKNAMDNDFSWIKDGGALDKYIHLMKFGTVD